MSSRKPKELIEDLKREKDYFEISDDHNLSMKNFWRKEFYWLWEQVSFMASRDTVDVEKIKLLSKAIDRRMGVSESVVSKLASQNTLNTCRPCAGSGIIESDMDDEDNSHDNRCTTCEGMGCFSVPANPGKDDSD